MSAVLTRRSETLDLRDSVYINKRPRITAGADISDPGLLENCGFHSCREILIDEVCHLHYDEEDNLLTGREPWIGMECLHELRPGEFRVLHATAGVMSALLASEGMPCIEPLAEQRTALGTSVLVYGGYPVWTRHPALASLMLYQIRLAHFIMAGGLVEQFLDLLPHRGARLPGAIRSRDCDQLHHALSAIREGVSGLYLDWECMNSDDRYWRIVDSLVDAGRSGTTPDELLVRRLANWSQYNGTLSWWFDGGAAKLGHCDDWDEPQYEEYDDDENE